MAQGLPILAILAAAIVVGYLAGGRLHRLGSIRLHWWGLAFAGLALQAMPSAWLGRLSPGVAGAAVLVCSYLALLGFLIGNRRVPAARLMAMGLLLNLAVVVVNGGMPVSPNAVRAAAGAPTTAAIAPLEGSAKHHLMTEEDRLTPLGDVLPLPPPVGVVLSIGDVLLYAGMAWFVIQVMRGRNRVSPRPLAMWFPAYRGKHAPDYWRIPMRYRLADRGGAARQGT